MNQKLFLITFILGSVCIWGFTYWFALDIYKTETLNYWEDKWSYILGEEVEVDPFLFDNPVWQGNTTRDPRPGMWCTILAGGSTSLFIVASLVVYKRWGGEE